ncbi:hypothetical protein [Streptomyces sp900116325]|uniref:hypothetical protein n=1 Tax=Streptomyces sp. 900116325 TaxID=3154295 RepID=UPI0033B27C6B
MPTPAAPRPSSCPPDHALGLLIRTAHALRHWWPRHPASAPPTRQVQLLALAALLDEAVDAQPVADWAVAACGEPGPVPRAAAQDAGLQISVYHRLMVRLRAMHLDEDVTLLGERASRLLAYHEWILHQAVNLAFTAQPDPRIEDARLRLNGLGKPAVDLRELRDEVRACAEQVCCEGSAP